MFPQFRDWGIKTKIMLILLVSICVIAAAVETIIVPLMQRYFFEERQLATQRVVEVAHGILEGYAREAAEGHETPDQARRLAIQQIRSIRFSGREYFWIHDLEQPIPRMIMHPTLPLLDGKVLDAPQFDRATGKRTPGQTAMQPPASRNLFVAMNEVVASAGEGFVAYSWPKPGPTGGVSAELYPKISYVKRFTPWGWVVGSGVYVDDVRDAVAHIRLLIHTASILFCCAAIAIYWLLVRYISRPVIGLAQLARRIAGGEYGAQLPVASQDEVGVLSESLNRMSSQVQQKTVDLEAANRELQQELAERRRIEESLRESEEKFRTLVDSSFDVIFALDASGVFRFVSRSWETHFGFPAEAVIDRDFAPFVHPDDAPGCLSYLEQVMECGRAATSLPYRVRHANGTWRLFIANGTLHRDAGGNPLYIGIGRDITDEKRLEEERLNLERQFLHAQKLESLGVMAGGIAHDFNNILAVIIGNLELSAMQVERGSTAAVRIERAMQASRRAADLTQQMLAYSGKGVFALRPLDLNRMLRDNTELFRTMVPKTITLLNELADGLPPVRADIGQLQQVVMNLVTNASEAIGEAPGRIMITTALLQCDEKLLRHSKLDEKPSPGTFVALDVTDSGCGMDKDTQQRIFEPFYTTKFTGRGLGMSSVMGIVKSHGGAILLASDPGKGSTFTLLLPVMAQEETMGTEAAIPLRDDQPLPERNGTPTVLVVDDEEMVREVCREYLEDMGLRTICARNGREAVDIFRRQGGEISLIILDLSMPEMDGVATLRALRRIRTDVRVIISSGHAAQTASQAFADEKPSGFIQKPFQLEGLRQLVQGLLPDGQK